MFIHCQFLLNMPTVCNRKSPAILILASVRQQVITQSALGNVHGLHSRILGVMTEEVPEGEHLFTAISLSLFLTTRLPQQMAPMLTQRHCEAIKQLRGLIQHKDV